MKYETMFLKKGAAAIAKAAEELKNKKELTIEEEMERKRQMKLEVMTPEKPEFTDD